MGRATDDAGLWRFKGGDEAYAFALRRFTTTNLTADEIHQIGLKRVAAIEQEMDGILRRLGRTEGTLEERVKAIEKSQSYPLTEDGRKQIMADTEQILRDAEKRAALQFDVRPKAPVVAQPYPRFREANAAASYSAPAPDGSRPGTFQIPLRPERMTKYTLRTLVYHETVPGHHFQIALEMENAALPRFRRIRALGGISALSEGWGLYAERLAAESGWYENDLEGQLGQLDMELFRARRLVVDTGIHAKHWTRQQAIDYGIEASEVERYVVNPGQACSYMMGELKILELRDKAKKALGDKFSIRDFHSAVLAAGTVPLDVLERQVDAYVKRRHRRRVAAQGRERRARVSRAASPDALCLRDDEDPRGTGAAGRHVLVSRPRRAGSVHHAERVAAADAGAGPGDGRRPRRAAARRPRCRAGGWTRQCARGPGDPRRRARRAITTSQSRTGSRTSAIGCSDSWSSRTRPRETKQAPTREPDFPARRSSRIAGSVRTVRRLRPGKCHESHRHTTESVIVQVSEGKGLAVGPMTWEFWEPGRWAWFDVDKVHEIRNIGTVPLEYIEVEVRRPEVH